MQTTTEQGAAITITAGESDGIRHPDPAVAECVYLDLRLHFGPGKYDYDCASGWVHPNAAALLRAAPQLLEALQEVIRISDRKHDAWDRAKAAIAKATGAA